MDEKTNESITNYDTPSPLRLARFAGRVQPAAYSLLEKAASDSDEMVRSSAEQALTNKR